MSRVLKTNYLPISASAQDQVLLVFLVENLEDTTQELQSRVIKFLTLPHDEPDWGISVDHFRDPDGNVI